MAGLASYNRIVLAGETTTVNAVGNLIVLRNSQSSVQIKARQSKNLTSGQAYELIMNRGDKWKHPEEFDDVSITNLAAFDQTIEILAGFGEYAQPPPDIAAADIIVCPSSVSLDALGTLIAAYNGRRHRIIIKSLLGNDQLFIGGTQDEVVTAGFPMTEGESVTLESRGEVWGQIGEGDNASVNYIEELYDAPTV